VRAITAAAHPNLALVKYWGQRDATLNLPVNPSISVNLSGGTTTTTVTFDATLKSDRVALNGAPADTRACARVTAHLDRVRALAGIATRADVRSRNDFPASAGVASSASAFAALSLAATRAAGLDLDMRALSILARKGSGSACRSIPDGFVEWIAGDNDAGSYARSLVPCGYWDLRIISVTFGDHAKEVSSLEGHHAAPSSPFYAARLAQTNETLDTVRRALLARDFPLLGMTAEREALSLHAIAMTSRVQDRPWLSGIYYWKSETLRLIHTIQTWRQEGLAVYFTLDAGPSVHLICEAKDQADLESALAPAIAPLNGSAIISEPGRGAWIVDKRACASTPADTSCIR